MSSYPSIAGDRRDEEMSSLCECVGPLALAPATVGVLDALAGEAGAADLAPFAVCATALARRLSPAVPRRAWVIRGPREAVTPPSVEHLLGPDGAGSLRSALQHMADPRYRLRSRPVEDAPVDVTILVSQDGRNLYVESMTSAGDAPLAMSWARAFLELLGAMADRPDAPLLDLPVMHGTERHRVLHGLNPYRKPQVRHRTATGPFEDQVERTPGAVALVDEDGATLTYRELNDEANRLAHYLRERGAGPGARIGVCVQRSLAQFVALHAAVKTGSVYVPLDEELPDGRLGFILGDAGPGHVLTDAACRGRIPGGPWQVHDVIADRAAWQRFPTTNPVAEGTSAALLHILYTSGTTGRPKGVAYPADGVLAHLDWMQSRYPFLPGDTAVAKTSPGFDVSVWELFWPLYHGARVVICRPGSHRDPRHLADVVESYGVTMVFLPPTVMTPFLGKVRPERAGALRWTLCGGEPVTPRIRDTFYATLPTTTLINCYGPTEAGGVTDMILEPDPGSPVVPLGRPAEHFRLRILDESLEPVPVGTPGEAYIGGEIGLAQAYWRAPGRTAERFVPDPHAEPGARMYRTGDLCRYRDDGVLEHLGRIDRQVKIRGLRIEPGEIESVLATHPAVADCAVVTHGDPPRLVAFVVPPSRVSVDDVDAAAIAAHAAGFLPEHMRPEQIVPILRVPVTVNGKVDTAALLRLFEAHRGLDRAVVAPADELEARLVELYSRVLRTSPVSVLDTFGQLGGHSLVAFQVLEECERVLHAKPDVVELLTGTLRDVAASLRASGAPQVATDRPGGQA